MWFVDLYGQGSGTFAITVNNVAPIVNAITVSVNGEPDSAPVIEVGTAITAKSSFIDPAGIEDKPYTVTWGWGDGSETDPTVGTVDEPGNVEATHAYETPGVYTIGLAVKDKDGGIGEADPFQFVVVYDPNGGFVTGE